MAVNVGAGVSQPSDPIGTAASIGSAHLAANEPHGSRTTMPIDTRTGTQTLASGDKGHMLTSTDASDTTYTVPTGQFGGTEVVGIRQGAAGAIIVAAGAGMTNLGTVTTTAGPGADLFVHFQSATTYYVDGNAI